MAKIVLLQRNVGGTVIEAVLNGSLDGTDFVAAAVELTLGTVVHVACDSAAGQRIPAAFLESTASDEFRLKAPALPDEVEFSWEMEFSAGTAGKFKLGNLEIQIPSLAGRAKTGARLRL